MHNPSHLHMLGARILSEANDLKRDLPTLACEIGVEELTLRRVVSGQASPQQAETVISRMSEVYPIDGADLRLIEDDCDHGVKIMTAEQSAATSRIFERPDRTGALRAYYEYRDTAFSRLSPFRPEWIRELRVVDDRDPYNGDVVFNHGHFLHQYSFYIGPVNHYWETGDGRFCHPMGTGDSSYTTPFCPHTFTSRAAEETALILAITFGGNVRRAQKEIYALGARAARYRLDQKDAGSATRHLVQEWLDDGVTTISCLTDTLRAAENQIDLQEFLQSADPISDNDLDTIACALDINPWDLQAPPYGPAHHVLLKTHHEDRYPYPSAARPLYVVSPTVRTPKVAAMRGVALHVQADALTDDGGLESRLHGWLYNYGSAPLLFAWTDGPTKRRTVLNPGDSAYIQPFIRCTFARTGKEAGDLCLVRVAGHVGVAEQREISQFAALDRALTETSRWF